MRDEMRNMRSYMKETKKIREVRLLKIEHENEQREILK